jgi:hypothetical protein
LMHVSHMDEISGHFASEGGRLPPSWNGGPVLLMRSDVKHFQLKGVWGE